MPIHFVLLAAESSTLRPTLRLSGVQPPTTAGNQQLGSLWQNHQQGLPAQGTGCDLWLLSRSPPDMLLTKSHCHLCILPILHTIYWMVSASLPTDIDPHAKPANTFSDGCSANFLMLLATPPRWHEETLDKQHRIDCTTAACAMVDPLVRKSIGL